MGFICDVPKSFCNLREKDGSCRLGVRCEPIVDECTKYGKCDKIEAGYCKVYVRPSVKWRQLSGCPLAPVSREASTNAAGKVRVGQQKQKKRGR